MGRCSMAWCLCVPVSLKDRDYEGTWVKRFLLKMFWSRGRMYIIKEEYEGNVLNL